MKLPLVNTLARFVIVAVPLVLFVWLAWQELVPTGVFHVIKHPGVASAFVDRLLPDSRIENERLITGDPAFFFVHPHRGFETIEAEIQFKNNGARLIEFGGLAAREPEVYDLHPLQNTILDELDWPRITQEGITLYQRNPVFTSVGDFLAQEPERARIATYQYDLKRPFILSGYMPSSLTQTIDVSLRGGHIFKTYIKDESLDFTFEYMDMNRDEGSDAVEVIVFNALGEPVADAVAFDDNNRSNNAVASSKREMRVQAHGLAEGVYKVELRSSRDIFWRRIITKQHKIVFQHQVFLADEVGYQHTPRPVRFYTQAKRLVWQTRHVEGVQTVSIGREKLEIARPYERYIVDVEEAGLIPMLAPRADVIVETDGPVAFSREHYFNPDPVPLRFHTNIDRLSVDYVIAHYTPPQQTGEWLTQRVVLDARVLDLQDGTWKLVFSIPGIDEQEASVEIGDLHLTFRRPALLSNL